MQQFQNTKEQNRNFQNKNVTKYKCNKIQIELNTKHQNTKKTK